ncbi:extracellular solute-binding protein [Paenibacillus sp. CC-CFT747]|nr:extracellular solute-binding protein [Paenibacillus sp. CC-CFT747]
MTSEKQSRKTFRLRLEQMQSVLRGEILTGKRKAGEFLPSERDLTRQFHLSNKLVRTGLEELVAEGLIVKIPRVGNRVAEQAGEHTVTLRFGYHASLETEAQMEALLADFHSSHPAIHVQPIRISYNSYASTVHEYLDAGIMDVVTMNHNNFDHFCTNGKLDLLQEQEPAAGVYPELFRAYSREGRLYAKPFLFSPLVLCYNRRHFREKGLPCPSSPTAGRN